MVWRALNNPEADWRLDDDKENGIITNKGMWIINNGERTFVDAWLSRQWVFWVLTSREHNPPMAYIRVSDQIINPCTRKWNLELIRTEVTSQEMEVISQIPLPLSRTNNKLIWPHILRSRNGQASVKSAYHSLPQDKPLTNGNNWNNNMWWCKNNKLWKMKALPKVSAFMWKLSSKALALCSKLKNQGMEVDTQTSFCAKEERQ